MGNGFWILVSDGYGSGLNLINPRLHHDEHGNNWWGAQTEEYMMKLVREMKVNDLYGENWRIVGWREQER